MNNTTTNTTVPSSSSLPSSARNDSNSIKMKLNNAISAIMTYQNSTSSSSTNNTTSTTSSNKGDNSLLLPITACLFALQQSLFELLQYEETLATKAAVIHDLQAQLIEKKEEINALKATPTLPPLPPALPSPSSSQDSTPPQTLRKQPSSFFTPAPNPPLSTTTSATPAVPIKQSQNTFITTNAPTTGANGDGNRRPQPPVSVMIDEENGKLRIMISKARKKVMLGEYTV